MINDAKEENIPLKNLPFCGLTVYPVDETLSANNVLSAGFNKFSSATVIGREDSGDMYFASSHLNTPDIMHDLMNFISLLETHLEEDENYG